MPFGLPGFSLSDNYGPINVIMSLLGIPAAAAAQREATNANREVTNEAAGFADAWAGGALNYDDKLGPHGTPHFSYNGPQDINQRFDILRDAMRGNQMAGLADFNNMAGSIVGRMNQLSSNILGDFANVGKQRTDTLNAEQAGLLSSFDQGAGDLLTAALNRQQEGMGILEGMGEQSRKNINRQFDAAQSRNLQEMQARGLGDSTLLSGARTATERERAGALGDLDESLRGQRFDAFSSLSGDVMNTRGANFANRMGLLGTQSDQRLGLSDALATGGFDLRSGFRTDLANTMNQFDTDRFNMGQQNRTDLYNLTANQQGQILANNQNAANRAYELITGITNAYPSTDPFQFGQQMGLGYGANQYAVAQENYLNRMSSPWNQIFGPALGGAVAGGISAPLGLGIAGGMSRIPGFGGFIQSGANLFNP